MSTCAPVCSIIHHTCPKPKYIVCHCACSLKCNSGHDDDRHQHHDIIKTEKNNVETQTDKITVLRPEDLISFTENVKSFNTIKCDQGIQTDSSLLDDQDLFDDAFLENIIVGFMDDDLLGQPEIPKESSKFSKDISEESSKEIADDISEDISEVPEETSTKVSKRKGSISSKELNGLKMDDELWSASKKIRKAAHDAGKKIAEMEKKVFRQVVPSKPSRPSKPRRSRAEETWELLPDSTTVSTLGNRYLEDIIRVDDARYQKVINKIPSDASLETLATYLIRDIIHPEYNLIGASFRGTSDKVSIMRKIFKQDPQGAKCKGKKRKSIYHEESLKLQVQESIIDHVLRMAKKTTYTLNDRKTVDRAITRAIYSINRAAATTSFIRH